MTEGSPPPTCCVSHVICHMSNVNFFYKVVKLVDEGFVINGATPSSYYVLDVITKEDNDRLNVRYPGTEELKHFKFNAWTACGSVLIDYCNQSVIPAYMCQY